MRRVDLAVYEVHTLFAQELCIGKECEFTGIAHQAEHALSAIGFSHADSITATYKATFQPGLGAVGDTHLVQLDVSPLHVAGDPGSGLAITADLTAMRYDLSESDIDGEIETPLFENLFHALADPDFAGVEDESGVWAPP